METKIKKIEKNLEGIEEVKKEFEKFVSDSPVFERGLIIRSFSLNIPEEIQNYLDKVYYYIYEFSLFLVLPFSNYEYARFSVSYNFKEPLKEENLRKEVKIKNIEKQDSHFMFVDQNKAFVEILFVAHPAPPNFFKDLGKCKKYLVYSQILSTNFALVSLLIREFSIDFDYYEKVL
jgi:hypothetical protein